MTKTRPRSTLSTSIGDRDADSSIHESKPPLGYATMRAQVGPTITDVAPDVDDAPHRSCLTPSLATSRAGQPPPPSP
jgi:hypothetical protein